jgi:hypothetical protein
MVMDLVADPCFLFLSSSPGFPRPLSIRFLVRQAREVRRPGSGSTKTPRWLRTRQPPRLCGRDLLPGRR